MGFIDSMKDFFGKGNDDFDDFEEYDEEVEEPVAEPKFKRYYGSSSRRDNVIPFGEPTRKTADEAAKEITVVRIKKYEEAEAVAEILKAGGPVIFDVIEMENATEAKSVVDFISGVVCGIGGSDRRVSGGIFMATPASMTIRIEENPQSGKGKWNMSSNR